MLRADPGRPSRAVPGHERTPRGALPVDVAGGAPDLGPVALGRIDLAVGELGLEAVDEAVVGEGAHPQLGRRIAAAEARLEPEREEQDGQAVLELAGARARIGDLAERIVRARGRGGERGASRSAASRAAVAAPSSATALAIACASTRSRGSSRLRSAASAARARSSAACAASSRSRAAPRPPRARREARLYGRGSPAPSPVFGVSISAACTATSTGAWNST